MNEIKKVVLYGRVSSDKQDYQMQLDALHSFAERNGYIVVDEIYEKISSKKKDRPGFDKILRMGFNKEIDAVVVWKYDRFARSMSELVNSLETFSNKGIHFVSIQEQVDTSTPAGKMFFGVIASFAEYERAANSERVRAGMEKARKHGTKSGKEIGRPGLDEKLVRNVRYLIDKGMRPVEIMRRTGVKKSSFYNIREEYLAEQAAV